MKFTDQPIGIDAPQASAHTGPSLARETKMVGANRLRGFLAITIMTMASRFDQRRQHHIGKSLEPALVFKIQKTVGPTST
jgi:hypothetical protein